MEGEIIEASQLPENEKVYLKKCMLGWRTVYPFKNEDGSLNWKNIFLGGDMFSVGVIVITTLVMFGFFYLQNHEIISQLNACLDQLPKHIEFFK